MDMSSEFPTIQIIVYIIVFLHILWRAKPYEFKAAIWLELAVAERDTILIDFSTERYGATF